MSASIADILQDARAFAGACEEMAERLDATAARLKADDLLQEPQTAFLRVLPLMCAFASPDAMAAFAARLRGLAARLDALPASADDLAKVMTAPATEFEAFEALIFNLPADGSTRVDLKKGYLRPAGGNHAQKSGGSTRVDPKEGGTLL